MCVRSGGSSPLDERDGCAARHGPGGQGSARRLLSFHLLLYLDHRGAVELANLIRAGRPQATGEVV